eukprot:TRINITY_DN123_c0_g3_i1.p1 TRINITY_DN123_c0_g3~~TRINITY_DN123_c0_g3_i1.p1  ORF type:complete len:321 (+),score=73.75 TRINITY_DN123_c0_g3_i1:62-1024(+)
MRSILICFLLLLFACGFDEVQSTIFTTTLTGPAMSIPNSGPASPFPSVMSTSGAPTMVYLVELSFQMLLQHPFPSDLVIVLASPQGYEGRLFAMNQNCASAVSGVVTFQSNATVEGPSCPVASTAFLPNSNTIRTENFDTQLDNGAAANTIQGNMAQFFSNSIGINGNWYVYLQDFVAGGGTGTTGTWTLSLTYSDTPITTSAPTSTTTTTSTMTTPSTTTASTTASTTTTTPTATTTQSSTTSTTTAGTTTAAGTTATTTAGTTTTTAAAITTPPSSTTTTPVGTTTAAANTNPTPEASLEISDNLNLMLTGKRVLIDN